MSEDAFPNNSLLLELPDTCQELAVQTLYHDFHHFSELPLELRLHIWRYAFPDPHEVPLSCGHGQPPLSPYKSIFPPITSRINRESRKETWLHYHLLLPPEKPNLRLCINPKRDNISIYLLHRWPENFQFGALEQHREFLIKVQNIHLRQTRVNQEKEELDLGECGRRILQSFPGLKSLKLFRFFHPRRPQWAPFYSPGRVAYDKYRERNMEQAQQALTEFYEKECLDPNGTMPWIFVHDC
jgi:hypothetical protein